jgi:hypothetical protein
MKNVILRLRRDNDYNYEKIKNSFIPADGEICLVDTARSGLRAVCGDGRSPFGELEFLNNLFVKGYEKDGLFYVDSSFSTLCETNTNVIYIDVPTSAIYYFDGITYKELGRDAIPTAMATNTTPGIMKLYSTIGQNEDGTMTQKAIADELSEKVEVTLNIEEELVIFSND